MSVIKIRVTGQKAEQINAPALYSGAVNFVDIDFTFDNSWDGLTKTYQFTNGEVSIDVISQDALIHIPPEVMIPGTLAVKVRGVRLNDDGTEVEVQGTVNPVLYSVGDAQLVDDAGNSPPVTPTLYDLIKYIADTANAKYGEALDLANDTQNTAKVYAEQAEASAEQTEADRIVVAQDKAIVGEYKNSAANSASQAAQSAEDAGWSEVTAAQVLSDLLAMLGINIATLTNGKLTHSQIPALSLIKTTEVPNRAAMLALDAQQGDGAQVLEDEDGYTHLYQLRENGNPGIYEDWLMLNTPNSFVAYAGHAVTADNAVNADKINNKRIVSMTQEQYDNAVIDPDTYYFVTAN